MRAHTHTHTLHCDHAAFLHGAFVHCLNLQPHRGCEGSDEKTHACANHFMFMDEANRRGKVAFDLRSLQGGEE